MLLGTFKTVFNSLFLVPTKTDTRHHMVVMERCCTLKKDGDRDRDRGRERNLQGQMVCSPLFLTHGVLWQCLWKIQWVHYSPVELYKQRQYNIQIQHIKQKIWALQHQQKQTNKKTLKGPKLWEVH